MSGLELGTKLFGSSREAELRELASKAGLQGVAESEALADKPGLIGSGGPGSLGSLATIGSMAYDLAKFTPAGAVSALGGAAFGAAKNKAKEWMR